MQKEQQKREMIRTIVIALIIFIILLLLIFSEDIIKMQNRNNVALLENSSFETIQNEANVPVLSAGMIPVKWDGEYWVITTQDDKEWYDYANGKLAHVMLNDGTYQSELIRDMEGKKLAENNIGAQVHVEANATTSPRNNIYMDTKICI